MKCRYALPFAVLLLGSSLPAQQRIEQRRAVTPTASVRLVGGFGALRIVGWDRDSVVVLGTVPAGVRFEGHFGGNESSPAAGAKMYLEGVEGSRDAVADAKLELYVPARARVWVKAGSAEIDVSGVTGGLDLNVIGGAVRVTGAPSQLAIEAMDAGVSVTGAPEWLRVKTATGDITISGGSSDAGLTSVSGTVQVLKGRFERAKIETVTGSVLFAGELARLAQLDINTHSGPIELNMSRKGDAEYDLATMTGSIQNGLTGRPAITSREGRGQEIGFMVGSGGARVYVRTFKGQIQLRGR
jgi:DUF4097 and DUF4098 domain-containing protein YvlB